MPEIPWWFNILKELSPPILAALCIAIAITYVLHIKRKNESLYTAVSNYEIMKSMNKENGQITVFPNLVEKANTTEYKYVYDCTLHINAIQRFPDGFSMTVSLSKEFKIRFGQNSEEKSALRKPKHAITLNSDYFRYNHYSSSRIYSFDFYIYSDQRNLDLDVKIDFGSGVINSKVFLNP